MSLSFLCSVFSVMPNRTATTDDRSHRSFLYLFSFPVSQRWWVLNRYSTLLLVPASLVPPLCSSLSAVCPCRLPHGAVHPVVHHHAGQAAHPEQPVRDWNTVSVKDALCRTQFLRMASRLSCWVTKHTVYFELEASFSLIIREHSDAAWFLLSLTQFRSNKNIKSPL